MRYLPLLALVACTSAPVAPFGTMTDIDALLAPSDALMDSSTETTFTGRYRVLHGASACNSNISGQGNPLVRTEGHPTVGVPIHVDWYMNPTAPFENRPAVLMIWFDESPPLNLTAFGYPGCLLWAPTKPGAIFTIAPKAGSMLTQEGGVVRLTWTPGPEWVGRKLFCQLAVSSPGANARGWLLSPGLEAWPGNQ